MLVMRQAALLGVFLQLPENKLMGHSSVTIPRDAHFRGGRWGRVRTSVFNDFTPFLEHDITSLLGPAYVFVGIR